MKNIFFSLAALLALSTTNAQVKEKGTVEITPKVGVSYFSETNDDGSTDANSGVEFGATIDYYFNNRWSLRSGLIFDKMGGRYNETITSYSYDNYINSTPGTYTATTYYYEDKLNYLSIPINANWHFGSTRKWNLNFGLSPSFLLSAKVNGIEIPKETIESFQLGFTFGIGYKIEITKKFGILIDYQNFTGLTNINKTNTSKIMNTGFSFNLGGVIQL